MEKEIKVLQILNSNSGIRQSDIAKQTNISVGKVNSTIKNLLEEGYVIKKMFSRKPHYILTIKGISVLEQYMKSSIENKIRLHTDEIKNVKQAVILSAGMCRDFDKPVGLLEIEDNTLIERTIDLLYQNNIKDIIVVVGYKNEYFDKLAAERNLKIVKNDRYKWTGTMISLSLASDYIKDDFILIESDLVFEERAISDLLKERQRDCVLITNEGGSGDEAFVEVKDGYIYKMSKDIHQLNKIDGEMIGISKISFEVFNKMMDEFKFNRNSYLNYEYMLLDIARNYNVGYLKIDDLVWAEIDNKEHFEKVIKHVYPRMKRKEFEISMDNIKKIICESLNVKVEEIESIQQIGGMTNKNFKIKVNGDNLVLRIAGSGTEDMIKRKEEKLNSECVSKLGINADLKYFNEASGIKITKFIENAETLNQSTAKKEENMKLVVDTLKTLHNSGITFENEFNVLELILHYEKILEKYEWEKYVDYDEVREKVMNLGKFIVNNKDELRPCHCDTVPENFVKSGDEKIYLIDWEYSGMNDPMWDLAAYSIECGFSEDDEELLMNTYFNGIVEDKYRMRVLINKILQDFLWSIWTKIKEARGDNFGNYGVERFNRAKDNLKKIK